MGNRAVIVHQNNKFASDVPCVYLHWNGGEDSVHAFLKAARELGIKGSSTRVWEEFARMLAESFFETKIGTTVYLYSYHSADTNNGDNGVYVVDDNMNVVDRLYKSTYGGDFDMKKHKEIYEQIISRHPVWMAVTAIPEEGSW